MIGYQLFPTRLGSVAIGWTTNGVAILLLPEVDETKTNARLLNRAPGAIKAEPPAFAMEAIERLRRLLLGENVDLSSVPLDYDTTPFKRRVYDLSRRIPVGRTRTYGELAIDAEAPGAARAVGQAMATNPLPLLIPCHRVVASDGRLCGFSAPGGLVTKKTLLAIERGERDLFAA